MKSEASHLLCALSDLHGASGREHLVRRVVCEHLNAKPVTDRLGSVIFDIPGNRQMPRIMLTAHMDEVGFVVQSVTREGYLRFVTVGAWWNHTLPGQRVRILTAGDEEISGVIAAKPVHLLNSDERNTVLPVERMVIDIGAASEADVKRQFGVAPGDTIVPDTRCIVLGDSDRLLGKAFDNRAGLAAMIQATQALADTPHPNTVVTVGTVQEEVGVRGATTAVTLAQPDAAIVLEGPPADDFCGSADDDRQAALGKGVQIRLMDNSTILNRAFSAYAIRTAEELDIPYQVAVRRTGGTDARAIHMHAAGVPSIVLGVPARYIHTQNSIVDINDYLATVRLTVALLQRLDEQTTAGFTAYL